MLAIYTSAAFTNATGLAVSAGADVEVRREDTLALAAIFSDEAGTVPLANPALALTDANGRFQFFVAGLDRGFQVKVTKGADTYTARNQAIGNAAQLDQSALVRRADLSTDGYIAVGAPSAPAGPGGAAIMPPPLGYNVVGGYIDWSVAGSVLTAAVKTWAGADPSAAAPVFIAVRSTTPGTGSLVYRKLTAATSVAIPNTATLGTANGVAFRLWCVAFDDTAGVVRLAIINCLSTVAGAGAGRDVTAIYPLSPWEIASSTLVAAASNLAQTFYTAVAAVTSKAYTILGYATWETGLATAGTWSAVPTRIQLFGPDVPLPGQLIQLQRNQTGAVATGATAVPIDDTIPQITEGDQFMSQAITPSSAANALEVESIMYWTVTADNRNAHSIHQDAIANALATSIQRNDAVNNATGPSIVRGNFLAGLSVATTFKARAGNGAGGATITTFNGQGGARIFGGALASAISVKEIMA